MTGKALENESPSLDYDRLPDYRKELVEAKQKSQEDFDKTVLTLSGGALGISFAFIRDIIGPAPMDAPNKLLTSWVCWGLSMLAVLISYYTSTWAFDTAIRQIDNAQYNPKPGGWAARLTEFLNIVGGILFVVGVGFLIWFVSLNME